MKGETLMLLVMMMAVTVISAHEQIPTRMKLERSRNWPVGIEAMKAHDRARHSRLLSADGSTSFRLNGSVDATVYGLYLTGIKLGNPPKEFRVQIDTSSSLLWVTCRPCYGCDHPRGLHFDFSYFDPSLSSSTSSIPCTDKKCLAVAKGSLTDCPASNAPNCSYTIMYGDDSGSSGYVVSSSLHLEMVEGVKKIRNSSASILFGCATSLHGSLNFDIRMVDGVLGLGPQDISVISQLSSTGFSPKIFAHCFKGSGNGGGYLVVGEISEPGIIYTPLIPSEQHYNIGLQSISVAGHRLHIDSAVFSITTMQGTILDSGSTTVYLIKEAFDPFIAAVKNSVSPSFTPLYLAGNLCYKSPKSDVFPSVILHFAGSAQMMIKPEDYMVEVKYATDFTKLWCFGWQRKEGITILGEIVMKDRVIVYDLLNQRIGWVDHDCDVPISIVKPKPPSAEKALSANGRCPSFRSSTTAFFTFFIIYYM